MKTEKTTAELIPTGYWLALKAEEPIEVIEILFKELKPTEKEVSDFWYALTFLQDYL